MITEDYDYSEDWEPKCCFTCGGPLPIVRPSEDICSERCKQIAERAADEAADNRVIEQGY